MAFKIITWNMDWWKRKEEQRKAGWEYLNSLDVNIALLQETKPDISAVPGYNILTHALPVRSEWGSAIVCKGYNFTQYSPSSSYEGSAALMIYEFLLPNNVNLLAINMYGQHTYSGYCSTTVHHMISDISARVFRGRYKNIVVAGDLNVTEQWDTMYKDPAHKLVFDRFDNLGLINCTKERFGGHVQTYTHPVGDFPWQNDYIFLNKNLSDKLISCSVHNEEGMLNLSDHFPVEIVLDI